MKTIESIIIEIHEFLGGLAPFIIALTVLFFIWSLFKLVVSSNEDARKEAIKMITFGVIGLFVMICVWGLVNLLIYSFGIKGLNTSNLQNGPGIPRF